MSHDMMIQPAWNWREERQSVYSRNKEMFSIIVLRQLTFYFIILFKLDLKCPFSGQRTCYSPITISQSNIKSLLSRNLLLPCCDTGHCRKSFLYDITNHNCYISNYFSRPLRSVIVFSFPCKRLMCNLLYQYHCKRILGKRLPWICRVLSDATALITASQGHT